MPRAGLAGWASNFRYPGLGWLGLASLAGLARLAGHLTFDAQDWAGARKASAFDAQGWVGLGWLRLAARRIRHEPN